MSTKVAKAQRSVTERARTSVYDSIKLSAASLSSANWNMGNLVTGVDGFICQAAIYQASDKAVEAQRQIERVKSLASLIHNNSDDEEDKTRIESIASSVALIGSFLSSPVPIPIASSGGDTGTSLYFGGDDFYGDLEITGKLVEYYIKTSSNGEVTEIYDTEEIGDEGYVPPRLLMCLFSHYAR